VPLRIALLHSLAPESRPEETSMKKIMAGLLLLVPLAVFAADNPDAAFFKKAAEGGIAEVDAGNLAQQKSTNKSVQDFGALMVKDHSAANDKLKSIADSKGISLPTSASVGQMAMKAKLEVLSGDTFDKSYIKGMIKGHQDTLALFRKEAASGQDPDAKAFAVATAPTIKSHLKKIEAIAASEGVETK
jgi:putative membrane protein